MASNISNLVIYTVISAVFVAVLFLAVTMAVVSDCIIMICVDLVVEMGCISIHYLRLHRYVDCEFAIAHS